MVGHETREQSRRPRSFTSSRLPAADRGRELGERHGPEVASTVDHYRRLFAARATRPFDVDLWAERAWSTIAELAPTAAEEIAGIAEGAGLPVREVALLNARTELLAVADPTGTVDECSTVVSLPAGRTPVAVQTWDWYDAMADDWFVWTVPLPDGSVIRTVTEYGVLGKIGVGSRGIGVLFNMLRHSDDARAEEEGLGYPVHLLSRRILEGAASVAEAVRTAGSVRVSASTALTVVDRHGAASVEVFGAGPGVVEPEGGLLVRTNHFLSEAAAEGCLASTVGPGSEVRLATLLDAFGDAPPPSADAVVSAMHDHREVGGVCSHPDRRTDAVLWHATLATVAIDVDAATLDVSVGGPCRWRPTGRR
jgi:isopenicillin-N N-acyltransferase-like protein